MDWNRAKDYMLVCLIVLNIIFGFFIIKERYNYILKKEDINNLLELFDKRNITLKSSLPNDFSPKRYIAVSEFKSNLDVIIDNIFKKKIDINDFELKEGVLMYDEPLDHIIRTETEAKRISEAFINNLKLDLCLYRVNNFDTDSWVFNYMQVYEHNIIYGIGTRVYVTPDNLKCDVDVVKIEGYLQEKNWIHSSVEALFMFMKGVSVNNEEDIVIYDVEQVYFKVNDNSNKSVTAYRPAYMVLTSIKEEPFFIAADSLQII